MTTQRTALVTGATRGIGAAIAGELRQRGVEVLTPSRSELNLADPSSVEQFVSRQASRGVDILVNNAGVNFINRLEEIQPAHWQEMYQVNLHAPFRLMQALAPGMKSRGWGRIVNVSSVFSLVTREKRAAYSVMKSGLNGLTRTAAVEWGPAGVLVNAVCPGYVATEMTRQNNSPAELEQIAATVPLRRLAEPVEIARFIGFLCSDENTYITGQMLVIDGGFLCQ